MTHSITDRQLADGLRRAFLIDAAGTDGLDAQLRAIVLEEILGALVGTVTDLGDDARRDLELAAARAVGRISMAYVDLARDVVYGDHEPSIEAEDAPAGLWPLSRERRNELEAFEEADDE